MVSQTSSKFYLSTLISSLFLTLILLIFSVGWTIVVLPLVPAAINAAIYYFLTSGWFLKEYKFSSKYFVLKVVGLLLNFIMFLVFFLANERSIKFGIFVYLVSYLFFLFHFTYFVTKGIKEQ